MLQIVSIQSINQISLYLITLLFMTIIKGAFVFFMVYCIIRIFKNLSSDYKHLLWFFVICGLLVIPIASTFAPILNFRVLSDVASLPAQPDAVTSLSVPVRTINHGLSWSSWALIIWVTGIVVSSLRILIGKITLFHLAKRAHTKVDEKYMHILMKLKKELGITKEVILLKSKKCTIPFTCRIFKPIIVLPYDMDDWPKERIRLVVIHELAHIRRKDNLTQFIARMICSLFWLIPFVWIAYSNLYLEQEKAADSFVIQTKAEPVDYAKQLLCFACCTREHIMLAGLFLSKGRKMLLEKRIENVLNFKRDNTLLKEGRTLKTIKLILGVILILTVFVFIGNCVTTKKDYVQDKLSTEDITGIWWVNTKMPYDKWILKEDRTHYIYHYLDQKENLPSVTSKFTIDDSWVDRKGNKFFKVHAIEFYRGIPGIHVFAIWKINESGTVFELNSYADWDRREGDLEKYPAEVNPNPLDSTYFIYYRK